MEPKTPHIPLDRSRFPATRHTSRTCCTSVGKHGTRHAHALYTNPRHYVIEDLLGGAILPVGSHVLALSVIISQIKPLAD